MPARDEIAPHLQAAARAVAFVRGRNHLSADETEEFESFVRLRFLEDETRILGGFRGEGRLDTYVAVVVQRLFLDFRNERWGRWRPSTEARRMGPAAVLLERLLHRDDLPREQALEIAARRIGPETTRRALEDLCDRLPLRARRRIVGEEALSAVEAATPGADNAVESREREERARRVAAALDNVLSGLEPEDRLVLTLHYRDGVNLSAVARAVGEDVKRMHRRAARLLSGLREGLSRLGIGWDDIGDWIGRPDVQVPPALAGDAAAENRRSGPSRERKGRG